MPSLMTAKHVVKPTGEPTLWDVASVEDNTYKIAHKHPHQPEHHHVIAKHAVMGVVLHDLGELKGWNKPGSHNRRKYGSAEEPLLAIHGHCDNSQKWNR
eukprot:1192400-Prorocentrum_minimum.AAC.3